MMSSILSIFAEECWRGLNAAISQVQETCGTDVPAVLSFLADDLKRAPFPGSWQEISLLTCEEAVQLLPIISTVCCFAGWLLLLHSRAGADGHGDVAPTYWLTRLVLLRGLALCYLVDFFTSACQKRALIGQWGLQPLDRRDESRAGSIFAVDLLEQSLKKEDGSGDLALEAASWLGVLLSLVLLTDQVTSAILPAILWWLHLSIRKVGVWPSTAAWDDQLAELGFLSIWLCPLVTIWRSPFPIRVPPPPLVLFLFRWYVLRLLISSGISEPNRTRAGACCNEPGGRVDEWQPMASLLPWYTSHLLEGVRVFEAVLVVLRQLVVPLLLLFPQRRLRVLCALALLVYHASAVLSLAHDARMHLQLALLCLQQAL